jgi:hypothetical protein
LSEVESSFLRIGSRLLINLLYLNARVAIINPKATEKNISKVDASTTAGGPFPSTGIGKLAVAIIESLSL